MESLESVTELGRLVVSLEGRSDLPRRRISRATTSYVTSPFFPRSFLSRLIFSTLSCSQLVEESNEADPPSGQTSSPVDGTLVSNDFAKGNGTSPLGGSLAITILSVKDLAEEAKAHVQISVSLVRDRLDAFARAEPFLFLASSGRRENS